MTSVAALHERTPTSFQQKPHAPRTNPEKFSLSAGKFAPEKIKAPTSADPIAHQRAWQEAQTFEATFMANVVEDIFKDSLNARHSIIHDEEGEDIFSQTMAEAYGEAMVETGTEIASTSIAGSIYQDLLKDLNNNS